MSDFDKINIYVPRHIGEVLDSDAKMFEVFKSDKRSINRNGFLSKLIIGYYNKYTEEYQQSYNTIKQILIDNGIKETKSNEIADLIQKNMIESQIPSRKGKNPARLSLKPTNETEGLINYIMNNLVANDYISQYFCRMLISYSEKPFFERERIIFKDNYDMLTAACERKKAICFTTIWNKKKIHQVVPYKIVVGKDERFNYLICAEDDEKNEKQEARSYRLSRLNGITYSGNNDVIEDETKEKMDLMVFYGPQYAIRRDNVESCVRLTDSGVLNYSRIYNDRPILDHIEEKADGHYYYFKCSLDQVFFYFRRFGFGDAEIVSPNSLRNRMSEFHSKSCELYK